MAISRDKFYITTPIYYVNDKPHIGHAYTTLLADILARWQREENKDVFFLVGTDEHGAKIETAALKAGKNPQEFCDVNAKMFKEAWQKLNISYDNFIRTSSPEHIEAVSNALQYLYDKEFFYKATYKGLYCRECEQYLTDDDLIDGFCPVHKTKPQIMKEESYFFKLSQFGPELERVISSDKFKIEPEVKKNEILSFLRQGLQDISISRQNVKWGIPLPFDKKLTTYVWIDAFLNYLTGLGWKGKIKSLSQVKKFPFAEEKLEFWPPTIQLMSKDILRVHATIWPALLLALGFSLPEKLYVHGFFTINGQKMSKSLGNVILPEELIAKFGVDGARYLLGSSLAYGHDGDISWEKLIEKYNADLANGLGNLVSRVATLNQKLKIKHRLYKQKSKSEKIKKLLSQIKIKETLDDIWKEVNWANKYIEERKVWELVKSDEGKAREALEELTITILDITNNLKPFMPSTTEKIFDIFEKGEFKKGEVLFPRV